MFFRPSESFSAIDLASSAICNCLLSLLLFLCHALPDLVRFVLLLLKRFLDSLYLVFSTRLLSASQLQSAFQSELGVLLSSRQPSIPVLLPCVDDFQYLCFSSSAQLLSSRHCSLRTSRLAVGTAPSVLLILSCCWVCSSRLCSSRLLLAMLFCHFVPLSEILVDLLLVVVQVLRLCAPFRQSGVASFVDFSSSLALLAVMLSLFSVFWRRFLQHCLVVVYCSEVRLMHLQRHYSACATS